MKHKVCVRFSANGYLSTLIGFQLVLEKVFALCFAMPKNKTIRVPFVFVVFQPDANAPGVSFEYSTECVVWLGLA